MMFGRRGRRFAAAAATGVILGVAGLALAEPASADTVWDCTTLCNTLHNWNNGSVSDVWYRLDSGIYQGLANMQSGSGWAEARAQCNDGIWYQSDIASYNSGTASHWDCGSVGIQANGVDYQYN